MRLLCLILALAVSGPVYAQRKSSGGSSWSGGSKPSGGSKSSWSGGSSSKPSPAKPAPAPASKPSQSPSKPFGSSSWSGGGSTSSKSGWSGGSSGLASKPAPSKLPPSFDSLAKEDAKKAESRASYQRSQAPKPEFKTPAGKTVPVNAKDPEVERLRRDLDHEKWVNRQQREDTYYARYRASPSYRVVVYNDPYHSDLNYALNALSVDAMARFIYHHEAALDRARINALYEQNITLQSKVAALQWQQLPRDPSYVPPGVDSDLIYNDAYIDAVYNPEAQPAPASTPINWGRFWRGVWWLIRWFFYLSCFVAFFWAIGYFLFRYRW